MEGSPDEKEALKANHEYKDGNVSAGEPYEAFDEVSNVKFVNGSDKIDASFVDIKIKDPADEPANPNDFVGLKKDELMLYAKDPYWVKLRIILLVLFAVLWVGMLVAAIVIIVVAPKCPPRPQQDWWETAVVYHIHPKSFLDTDGDGYGDLKGIHKKVDYLKDTLGVSAICLGPIQPRSTFDNEIIDYKSICHRYGSEEDFHNLRVAMHKRGLKLILDFVPNHTSRKHTWFNSSLNGAEEFKDYYIWHRGKELANGTRHPPNNWMSIRGGSAWEFEPKRGEYYYHSFSKDEPDLNLRNPNVVKELDDALLFWLKKKVDGFRFVGASHLVESTEVDKDEVEPDLKGSPIKYENLDHELTAFQPESYALVNHWRQLLDNYGNDDGRPKSQSYPRLMIVDSAGQPDQTMRFSFFNDTPGANLPTNKALIGIDAFCKTECIHKLVDQWMDVAGNSPKISNWQVGNVDVKRIATRIGNTSFLNAIHMLLMTLPGTAMTYYGDELGMHDRDFTAVPSNYSFTPEQLSRAGQRTPMQWSDHHDAGFTTGTSKPWLPVTEDYQEINVDAELAHGSGMSSVKVFSKLVTLRKKPSIQWGAFHSAHTRNIYYFVRQAEGFPGLIVAINFGTRSSTVNFKEGTIADKVTSDKAKIVASTYNFNGDGRSNTFADGTEINLDAVVYLKPGEGIVLEWQLESSLF